MLYFGVNPGDKCWLSSHNVYDAVRMAKINQITTQASKINPTDAKKHRLYVMVSMIKDIGPSQEGQGRL